MPDKAIKKAHSDFVIYETDDKIAKISVRMEEETVWLTQAQLSELFLTSRPNITMHIKNIFEDAELQEISVCKDFLHTAAEVVYNRIDNEKMMLGITNFKGNYITKFLTGRQLKKPNRNLMFIVNAKCGNWKAISTVPCVN